MRRAFILLTMILAAGASSRCAGDDLAVYPPVPGLAASEHYTIRVRPATGGGWQPVFAWQTTCKAIEPETDGYFDTLAGWTHTYCNFETSDAVEIEITSVEGITIADSADHSLMLIGPYRVGHPNQVTWTKIFTWRVNGDGINPFGNTLVEDCDVIYARATWHHWTGGRVFNMRGEGGGEALSKPTTSTPPASEVGRVW